MTDEEIAAMVLEAERLGPMTALEFQEQTDAIRAYARQAWQAPGADGEGAEGLLGVCLSVRR